MPAVLHHPFSLVPIRPEMPKISSAEPDLSVVVPVYNEENNVRPFLARLIPVLERIGSFEVIFCLDPCRDRTEQVILEEAERDPRIGLMVFSRRFGQPAATMAGILNCRGAACVVIDVDMQDPPELIEPMFARFRDGDDVVYAKRRTRAGETWVKKLIAEAGYKVINAIAHVQIPRNTGDFRILSRRVIEELRLLPEGHGFLRGMVALVGFRQSAVEYDRDPRLSGAGNYNRFTGSLRIGLNGIFGFSSYPLSLVLFTGLTIAAISVLMILVIFFTKLVLQQHYPLGIPTITVLVLFMGAVQLIAVGVLGEYIGRIYDEVRRRPMYIVDRVCNVPVIDPRGPNSGIVTVRRIGAAERVEA